ncbi:MAG: glycosyltransferase [Oleispira sp.]|nr:glycosyltransferase [Oleispira sp.]
MNILLLCTYPVSEPAHGGQHRVKNIVDTYRAAGHLVDVVGVLGSDQYKREKGFMAFPCADSLSTYLPSSFLMEDYAISQLFSLDEKKYRELANLVQSVPSTIHVEQPWLFQFAMRYKNEFAPSARIIYGSQNIEWELKYQILSSYVSDELATSKADLVKDIELNAIRNADAVICVSENDLLWTKKYSKSSVILAPNGVKPWESLPGNIEAKKITQLKRYVLYCASGHPPNIKGFFDLFSDGFGSLKPDERLVIAGGAGLAIAGDERVHQSPSLAARIDAAGFVSQECLSGLLDDAQCIVLPITQGGGTNLKTAEALWAGKYIVATTTAMRGFESFMESPGVFVENEPAKFKRALRLAMGLNPLILSEEERSKRRSVLWESCLKLLPDLLLGLQSGEQK